MGVPIASYTTPLTGTPTHISERLSLIFVETASDNIDSEAIFYLTVIVEDYNGRLMDAWISIYWLDGRTPISINPTADIEIPIAARLSPFEVIGTRPGYKTVR